MSTLIVFMMLSAVLTVELEPSTPVNQIQTIQHESITQTQIQKP
ncbi:MAG: hypothetical protein ACKOX6_01840 [Bdellovibrio sp.]